MGGGDTQRVGRVGIVGAGMVGLCTAWSLQAHGVEVTVFDREGVAAGASWGNAGWLTPGMAVPLPEPAVLRYGVRALISPNSPVYVPPTTDTMLMRFLLQFARNCTMPRWRQAMQGLIPLNNRAFEAFDALVDAGIPSPVRPAEPFIAAYRTEADREVLLEEYRHVLAAGQKIEFDRLTGAQARDLEPALSEAVTAALLIHGQRFLDPADFVVALGEQVRDRGGTLRTERVEAVGADGTGALINGEHFDAVVIASGAHLGQLAEPFGVRTIVQAGRGYSFTVECEHLPAGPVYFPTQRLACTPLTNGRLRVAGMMEFRPVDTPLDPRRIQALVLAGNDLLAGANLHERQDEWVGARPVTPDGLPVIGRTRAPSVYVAGGHGMWGMLLGPITGQLLADYVVTGREPAELAHVNPLRNTPGWRR
ncbi:MAG: FAD-dependent oxidoreductase [Austwickia sp.]|jgi:D-amino-acid dehydrogenase|nr:FAD-dependent oxidoreductase [Austwickia sp.]MBK8437500.1 FAD-dependent oxidoreductase [Austwickia sp.]MBK9102766.1 FAD-dependent oxidoreductase [Austwickia sp.]